MAENIVRPTFVDTNAFETLRDKDTFNQFLEELDKSNNPIAKELGESLRNNILVQEPITVIEHFYIPQKKINKQLRESIIYNPKIKEQVKILLEPFIKEWAKSNKDHQAYVSILSKGFCNVVDYLYDFIFAYLQNSDELSYQKLSQYIDSVCSDVTDPSTLFLFQHQYASDVIANQRNELIIHLTIESIIRFGDELIGVIYTGDQKLKDWWETYISSYYFSLWRKGVNISDYRNLSKSLDKLNAKEKEKFFPIDPLRPFDDTLDSYLTHLLTFGWFNCTGELTSILGFTCDPVKDVMMRIQQYQSYLAYARNPLDCTLDVTAQILHDLKPGILFTRDKNNKIQYRIIYNASVSKCDGKTVINHSFGNVVEL